jgi:alpha-D-xyloside xylohydrolase
MVINRLTLLVLFFVGAFHTLCNGQNPNAPYKQDESGITVTLKNAPNGVKMIRLKPINAKIVRVTATPTDFLTEKPSLMAVTPNNSAIKNTVSYADDKVILLTDSVKITVSTITGLVEFYDSKGNLLVKQSKFTQEPAFVNAMYNGESSYRISQYFDSQTDEAYYGLGQHQQGIVNYKGRHVDLIQNNTEVAVPFVVSSKNYGILWDNNAITTAGDIRPLEPLHALKLYNKGNEQGWLTASYSLKQDPTRTVYEQAVSDIDLNWLSDVKRFPDSVKMADAIVTYEGAIEGAQTGLYQLQIKYGGYIKVWMDGKQLMDYWRQSWNPATALVDLNLQAGKSYHLKMQWIPSGSESYLGVNLLLPAPENIKNTFAFTSEAGNNIDYYLIYGQNADSIISGYRAITGKAVMLPMWAMGLWQSRERYKTQDEILTVVKEFRDRKIPLDNIVLDWSYWKQEQWGSQEFDPARFADPDGMIKQLHNQHINFMISVWPKFYEGTDAYNTFNKSNFLYKRNIANRQRDWIAKGYVSTFYDAFNPEARKAFWELISKKIYTKGIDAWWLDATEPDILSNASVVDRKLLMTPTYLGSSTQYFNAFPLQNAKGVYEGQRALNLNNRVFILTRSAFGGLQRYGAATWSGDIASRWEDMKSQIAAGINFSLSGMPYWTMDIGGFAVEPRYENAKGQDLDEWRESMTRWYQFGAFVPLFRVHGQFPFREIYNVAPKGHPAYQSMLYYNKLRYRLMPYIYSLAGKIYHQDYTIMRGLIMDFAADKNVEGINDQYMFGPSLLINPVYKYEVHSRDVYLPKGNGWYDLYSGKYFKGGNTLNADAPYNRMPVFVKAGSIIPFGPEIQYTNEKPAEPITLYVYTGANATFTLYEDEGTNYNYEKGEFSQIAIVYNEESHTLTVGNRSGRFNGMVGDRTFRIVTITPNAAKALNFDQKPNNTINYNGKNVSIKL